MAVEGPIVAVRGESFREVPPELARFTVTVRARDRDRRATLERLAARSQAIRELIDGYGPAIDRRETGDLHIRPELKKRGERVTGYDGTASTTVTVTDFTVLGELMLRLADQEQTSVAGPWWQLRPDSPVHQEARRAAVDAAIQRAREYAEALGAELTALVELADTGMAAQPMMMAQAAFRGGGGGMMGAEALPELDLDPQQQQVNATIEARFTISTPTVLASPAHRRSEGADAG